MASLITVDLSPVPSRTEPTVFSERMDTWLSKILAWTNEANALASGINIDAGAVEAAKDDAITAKEDAESAQTSAEAAEASALIAANVSVWDAGGIYAAGAIVLDPADNYKAYTSQQNTNTNHTPNTDDGTWWQLTIKIGDLIGSYVELTFEPTTQQKIDLSIVEADGSVCADVDYPELLAAWGGKIAGAPDSTHFYLPKASGRVSRAWDHGAGIDTGANDRVDRGDGTVGDAVGTLQGDQMPAHAHWSGWSNEGTVGAGIPAENWSRIDQVDGHFQDIVNGGVLGAQGAPDEKTIKTTASGAGTEVWVKSIYTWKGIKV